MANKRYDQFPAGTYDPTKILLQANAVTGALEKVNLPVIPDTSNLVPYYNIDKDIAIKQNAIIGSGNAYGCSSCGGSSTIELYSSATGNMTLSAEYYNIILQPTGGKVGIAITSPTALLHIQAGTAAAGTAPIKLTAGALLTAIEEGAIEWDGTTLFISQSGVRQSIAYSSGVVQKFSRLFSPIVQEATSGTSATPAFIFNIPANTFTADGDTVEMLYWGGAYGNIASESVSFVTDFGSATFSLATLLNAWSLKLRVIRSDSSTVQFSWEFMTDNTLVAMASSNGSPDFTTAINTSLELVAPVSGAVYATAGYMNLQKV